MTVSRDQGPWSGLARLAGRFVHIGAAEIPRLLLSFATFFCVLSGYYVLRPVRDEMGVSAGADGLERLFLIVFLVMLAAVPVFGAIVARFPRRRVVPVIYAFFIANLVLFWFALNASGGIETARIVAQVFFVWSSVFNLFVVSMFWVLMSEFYDSASAKRLYGFIAAGGTAGAITGPLIARSLSTILSPHDLLLVSAALLGGALFAVLALRRSGRDAEGNPAAAADLPAGGRDILSGAVSVFRSPYLFRIALFILLANLIGTYFYLEQSRIVGEVMTGKSERVHFFATRDLAVNVATLLMQVFVAGRIMERYGLAVPLAALPLSAALGLAALTVSPTLDVVAAIMVAERAISFSLTNPAIKVLWTGVPLDEKYKAQNFVDTVVYRGGDAASGWIFNSLAKSMGLGGTALAVLSAPLVLVWFRTGLSLAAAQKTRQLTAAASA